MLNRRSRGNGYEKTAAAWLQSIGFQILCCNFRSRFGEIDIIARENGVLVFVEVKYRAGTGSGTAAEAVNGRKQRKICRVSDWYRGRNGFPEDMPCRFDVVAAGPDGMRLYRNAFPYIPAGR